MNHGAVSRSVARIGTISFATYREAVRTRLLLGVFALGLAACAYSVVVASMSAHNEERVVADLGSAATSLFGIVVAIVLGSTSLYREVEQKMVFPILSRPIRRWEYLVGKYLGTVLTVVVFVATEAAVTFLLLSLEAGAAGWKVGLAAVAFAGALVAAMVRARGAGAFVAIPWSIVLAAAAWSFAGWSSAERQLVLASSVLAVLEVCIVAAAATLFASFSSPAMTATCTFMLVVIGRSADTLAHLPKKLFGPALAACGRALAHVFPNLHVFVPPRSLLLGDVPGERVWPYVAAAAFYSAAYAAVLLVISAFAFRKRDFS